MIKKTLIYLAGSFSSKIFGILIIPIYAAYLSPKILGEYDFQVTIANLLMPILVLALWESVLRFGLTAEEYELRQILSTTFFICICTLSLSFIILLCTYFMLYGVSLVTFLYVVMIILLPLLTVLGNMARATKKSSVFAFSGLLSSGVNMIGILILVVWMKQQLLGLLVSTIAANIVNITFLFFLGGIFRYVSLADFSKEKAKILIGYSAPLILNLFFGWFVSSFSRVLTNQWLGATANGVLAFASKFAGIVMQISGIVNMSVIEDAVLTMGDENWTNKFEKNIENVTALFFRVCFILMPVVGLYYQTVSNSHYQSSLNLVPILFLATLYANTSTLLTNIFSVFNKTSKIFITTIYGAAGNVVGAILFGYLWGIKGIVFGQMVGAIIQVISRYVYGNRIKSYSINWKKQAQNSLLFVIISLLVLTRVWTIQLATLCISCAGVIYLYRDFILNVVTRRDKGEK